MKIRTGNGGLRHAPPILHFRTFYFGRNPYFLPRINTDHIHIKNNFLRDMSVGFAANLCPFTDYNKVSFSIC